MENIDRELGWNDQIENDSPDFILLQEGDYDFSVTGFERGRHAGSEKLPACNKAIISITIQAPEGEVTLKHNLFLHTKTEGMLCAFFTGIGQRKKGEKLTMNWNTVVGSKGRCKIGVKTYEGRKYNEIKKFYEPSSENAPQQQSFTAGRF